MARETARTVSRPVSHWGSGSKSVRFCYYDHGRTAARLGAGRFQRSPLIVSSDGVAGLKKALAGAPGLRTLLREMVI